MNALIHYVRFLAGLDAPATQVTERELSLLLPHAERAAVVVEVGTFEGRTAAALAERSSGKVFSIDPFPRGRLGVCYGERIARRHARRRQLRNVHFISGLGHEIAADFREPVDLLFVDADHRYEAVRRDWQAWRAHLRPGSIAAFHDCRVAPNSPGHLGSMDYYERDLSRDPALEEVGRADSLSVFRVL
jgi:predicted O-methyltransferase YrrM